MATQSTRDEWVESQRGRGLGNALRIDTFPLFSFPSSRSSTLRSTSPPSVMSEKNEQKILYFRAKAGEANVKAHTPVLVSYIPCFFFLTLGSRSFLPYAPSSLCSAMPIIREPILAYINVRMLNEHTDPPVFRT